MNDDLCVQLKNCALMKVCVVVLPKSDIQSKSNKLFKNSLKDKFIISDRNVLMNLS